ncbi:MAG: deoxyribonuclease IV [Bacilli bacterium]|jgi:deoxyribonuclease-4|nr:deoxyribonuclease IV [Bacilli bacterium]
MKIGCHVSNSDPFLLLGAANEAIDAGANCFMIYLGAPQNTFRRKASEMKVREMKQVLQNANIAIDDVIVHAPYILNLAQNNEEKRRFAVSLLTSDIRLMDEIGLKTMVVHPGSSLDNGLDIGIDNIIQSLQEIFDQTKDSSVVIALETMAGKGNECCYRFEHFHTIFQRIAHPRLQACFDTCHVFDSGYDLVQCYEEVLSEWNQIVGWDKIAVIHVNDSKNEMGSKKDRHENIGKGQIGFKTLQRICWDERFSTVPKILETPFLIDEFGKKTISPYKKEIAQLKNK